MRAARRDHYGSSAVIRVDEIAAPTSSAEQVLIRVHAATVSRTDCALLAADPFFMRLLTGVFAPRLKTLGTDFAGQVEAVGTKVTSFKVGDRVFGINDLGIGSHAEYLVTTVNDGIELMPEGQTFEEAAASVEGGWYAYSFIRRARTLAPGAQVLINGATGAIGAALLQFCVHLGASVTAVGNSRGLELLKTLGATRVLDHAREDFTRQAEAAFYDYVFDAVGKSTFGACRHLLKPNGIYSSSALGPGWQNLALALARPVVPGKQVVFPLPIAKGEYLPFVRALVTERHFRPIIDRRYSLAEIRDAYAYVASGQKTGSVVLSLEQPPIQASPQP